MKIETVLLPLPLVALVLWITTCTGIASSPSSLRQAGPTLLELQLPSTGFPNPHSPFWVGRQELGFVTEEEARGESRGGLFVLDLQTTITRRLLDHPAFYPTVFRTEDRLSYVTAMGNQGLTLFTMSLTTGQVRAHEFDGLGTFGPSWSPDGRKVVAANLSYDANLFIADAQTKAVRSLGDLGRGKETNGVEGPDWSPEGRTIVYAGWDKSSRSADGCCYNPTISRLYVYNVNVRTYHALTRGPFEDRYPVYSPDGKQIVFRSNRSGNGELWLIGSDGKHLRRLTDLATSGLHVAWDKPSWSPDQSGIAFTVVESRRRLDKGGFPFRGSKIRILRFPRTELGDVVK
jgi:Tol biopolymer transport system component